MKNLKKIFLMAFVLGSSVCYGMEQTDQTNKTPTKGMLYSNGDSELGTIRSNFCEVLHYLQLLNKITAGSEIAKKISKSLLQPLSIYYQNDKLMRPQVSAEGYKKSLQNIVDELKRDNIINNEEYTAIHNMMNFK